MALPDDPTDDIFLPDGHLRRDLFSEPALTALHESVRYSGETRWDSVRSPHLFMGLLSTPDAAIRNWGERLGADLPRLLDQFCELFHQDDGEGGHLLRLHREFLSDNVLRVLREGRQRSLDHQRDSVSAMDLLISLFTTPQSIVAECFERIGVTAAKLTELAVMAEQFANAPR
ncbi:MAG TPA: Clp protease N-terminal domain-containing protein [Gemmataceae bacterium]|jgi:ATP-dependent Clp protease ATP-binding subunit ClpA